LQPKWDCNQYNEDECEDILNCDDTGWCTTDYCDWNDDDEICNKIQYLNSTSYNGIDECGVCPAVELAEPFFDSNENGIWDENEDFLDLINDDIFTQLDADYFYKYDCWDDLNENWEWTDEDEYTDVNNNDQWDPGEPVVDPDGDGYTPAEPFLLPGECIQIDTDYTYNKGLNCDGECFNSGAEGHYTLYSDSFFDDCSDCSCIEGIIDDENSFCNSNHLPNAGDSEDGTFEDHNSCIDLIFYNDDDNSIQDFTALSSTLNDNTNLPDSVILEWEYNPQLYVSDIRFIILKRNQEDSPWEELNATCNEDGDNDEYGTCSTNSEICLLSDNGNDCDTMISNATCNEDGNNDEYGICSSNSDACLLSNYGNDCINLYLDNDISYVNGHYAIKVVDSYDHESEILSESIAREFFDLEFELYNGNNLISFPAIPSDPSLSSIFFPIQDHVTGIIGPGIASSYIGDIDGDGIGDWVGVITEIDPLLGYWLKIEYGDMNGDGLFNDQLDFRLEEAYPVDKNQIYSLQSGANLVSYVGNDNSLINDAINPQQSKYFKSIIGEGVAASHQDLNNDDIPESWAGSLATLKHQKGYWIILDLNDCPTSGDNVECNEDDFGNAILEFNWE
jgi:hypothetical protein